MLTKNIADYTNKRIEECTDLELFNAVLNMSADLIKENGYNEGKKKLYYISAEFLIGKLLSNNLINLGVYDDVRGQLEDAGRNITELEEFENEPSLGNGGLGRLAACFLDSLAALGLPADGIGLAYHCGLFRQTFTDAKQYEIPDHWLKWGTESWMKRTDTHYDVCYKGMKLRSTMYEIAVTGYNGKCGRLRLFDTDSIDERLISDSIHFDKKKIAKNLTLFLYPDDSDEEGRILRIYQEYFMVSNAAQLMIDECTAKGSDLHDLADYAAVQINDTHPTLVIPELIRILTEKGISFEEAVTIVRDMCGYTNHTILAEALETWPKNYLDETVPQLSEIICRLDAMVKEQYSEPFVHIIDEQNRVHMANIDIHFSHSVNGVARLHTDILKNSELKPFYDIYPEKFNNKTNGITFRRWLVMCNRELRELISSRIGTDWIRNADELERLLSYSSNTEFLSQVLDAKQSRKSSFSEYLRKERGIEVSPDSIFDVQVKRLHEYKRQQLNLLCAIDMYYRIKAGNKPERPVTVFFGAKAAPAYTTAKDIIHAIICFSRIIEKDPEVSPYLKVVMLENYNVSLAEKLIPAADISEQISLASKEASGTSNMKFMLNGAVTLGPMDGANVEIAELVGPENIYTFGQSSDEVIGLYKKGTYNAYTYYQADANLKRSVDFLISEEMRTEGDEISLNRLYDELVHKDWFMTFPDFREYCTVKNKVLKDYEDRASWAGKMLVNISKAGFFSSDRTIRQYNDEIWHLEESEQK